ncbi:chemotaxis protein CheW [Salinirubellus salinus]|uniref:Chemotaxis protein CheW n=1 Tax=Salinirubellus salinus TaxID=1364945 RepID=A0A9E7QZP2_9EURY|nr:chemotaxis protein CheW [Salinirubellus salinus]UWM52991.1 chemotaxis protein CheW [Salinirubellus salinus]
MSMEAETPAVDDAPEGETVQVLEFALNDETYCVDIEYVAEIVDRTELTNVPNAPHAVEGVMDLRGRTTAIVNPKTLLGLADAAESKRIVIFNSDTVDDGATGWVVDEVFQVVRVTPGDVEAPPFDDDSIRGVVRREEELVIWVDPEAASAGV